MNNVILNIVIVLFKKLKGSLSMKYLIIFANCQGGTLLSMLNEHEAFKKEYSCIPIPFVQNIKSKEQIKLLLDSVKKADIFIYQYVNSPNMPNETNTHYLLNLLKKDTIKISFPSLYFNGYFPHLDSMDKITGPLRLVHDYIIAYCYTKGFTEKETLRLINEKDLYSKKISMEFVKKSIESLLKRERENDIDIRLSDYIKNNYKKEKLFNQFNHPKRIVFEFLTREILNRLLVTKTTFISLKSKDYLGGITAPVYPSTLKNLELEFKEEFMLYSGVGGKKSQEEVVHDFYKVYKIIGKNRILDLIKKNKSFIIELVDSYIE